VSLVLAAVRRGYQPVCCLESRLILARGNALFWSDYQLSELRPLARLPALRPLIEGMPSRLLQRIFRTQIQSAAVDGDDLFVVRRGAIHRVSLSTGQTELDFQIPQDRRLLAFAIVQGASERHLCFGEYWGNPRRDPVNIWRRPLGGAGRWDIAATFPAGSIDHIHAIQQLADGSVRVLTGDFDQAPAIWRTTADFGDLRIQVGGAQEYRACWLWEDPQGDLYYATDSQLEPNALRRVSRRSSGLDSEAVAPIPGSSIYAAARVSDVAFSTSVEPGELPKGAVAQLLERRPGPGIQGHDAVIYQFKDQVLREVFRARKDVWPMRLAQFGAFMFPGGTAPDGRIVAYGVAVNGYDGACLSFEPAA
jgi:hypothetical protein